MSGTTRWPAVRPTPASPERWSVHQPAVGPERVQAASHAEWRVRPEISPEDLAVIAKLRDHARGPARVEAEGVADARLETEEAPNSRIGARLERRDIRPRDPELLRLHGHAEH